MDTVGAGLKLEVVINLGFVVGVNVVAVAVVVVGVEGY